MQSRSNAWKAITADGAFLLETVAVIGGVEYSAISAPAIGRGLFSGAPSVGNCTAASMEVAIRTDDEIARSAGVQIKMRVREDADSTPSEWLPAGTYYITKRTKDYSFGLLTLECYDSMLMAQQAYVPTITAWPAFMADVVADIAAQIGVAVDSRTEIAAYTIPAPDGMTMMDVLSGIGAVNGGNWIITPAGALRLVPLAVSPATAQAADAEIHAVLGSLSNGRELTITGVTLTDGGNSRYVAGDSTGYMLTASSPYASQAAASALYEELNGLVYRPFSAVQALYDPALELGDTVRYANLVYSVVTAEDLTAGALMRATLSASTSEELEDEYPYRSAAQKAADSIRDVANQTLQLTYKAEQTGASTVRYTAVLYRMGKDVTREYQAYQFRWSRETETGQVLIGHGYSVIQDPAAYGYGGHLILEFTTYTEAGLSVSQGALAVASGDLSVRISAGEA